MTYFLSPNPPPYRLNSTKILANYNKILFGMERSEIIHNGIWSNLYYCVYLIIWILRIAWQQIPSNQSLLLYTRLIDCIYPEYFLIRGLQWMVVVKTIPSLTFWFVSQLLGTNCAWLSYSISFQATKGRLDSNLSSSHTKAVLSLFRNSC